MKKLIACSLFVSLLASCNHTEHNAQHNNQPQAHGAIFPASVTKPKVMIIGDSISAGPGCYKKTLAKQLTDNGFTQLEFVGSYTDDCGGGIRHSAVSCSTTSDFLSTEFSLPKCFGEKKFDGLARLMATHHPDMLMMQLGVNDVWSGGKTTTDILKNYAALIAQARQDNPNVVVVVAQIQKIITDNCKNQSGYTQAEALIKAVPAWAKTMSTKKSPVFTADLWTNSDPKESADCVHPNEAGAERMGNNWYQALKNIL
jgi:lysophospholipase L1-like esterase